ncbi:hypothetical protein QBC39DRAFT_437616 [Podospora conica]|nr:hypothetical protein QBC39DRAFT_437616 [Schizothecium conicum]
MGRSYSKKNNSAGGVAPKQWTAARPHKYCGQIDAANAGKTQKPNKAQHCGRCMDIKAALDKGIQRDTANRRQEKMEMGWGGMEVLELFLVNIIYYETKYFNPLKRTRPLRV